MVGYGLLIAKTVNIGDDIQSLAAMQFLPRVDVFLDRDNLQDIALTESIKVIMNGWFTLHPEKWPPISKIIPLFISFHISPQVVKDFLTEDTISYLKNHEPIGTRDIFTRNILQEVGIEAYFSGCLTLTLDYKYSTTINHESEDDKKILIIDLDEGALNSIPEYILDEAVILTHSLYSFKKDYLTKLKLYSMWKNIRSIVPITSALDALRRYRAKFDSPEKRLNLAEKRILQIANSRLVITSRLHAALPAVAFGIPVLFVHRNLNDPRFSGLLQFFNFYSISEFHDIIRDFDWDNPPDNPNRKILAKVKQNLIQEVTKFVNL